MKFILPFVATLLISTSLCAETPTAEQIQQWARELDSPTFKVREAASKNLKAAGAESAITLYRTAKGGSTEASDRALRILGELAEGKDAKAEAAARRQLRRLADGDSNVAMEAKSILNRKKNRLIQTMAFNGARCDEENGEVTYVVLDQVSDLEAVLPLLKEFPQIEYLSISNKRFTDGSVHHLLTLQNLRDLNLYASNIGDEGVKQLAAMKNLRRLPMGSTRITDAGLKTIGTMTDLEYVGMRANKITDAGLAHLKNLKSLTGLNISETPITDAGLKTLAPLTRLQSLYLHDTAVTDKGLELLKDFKDLKYLPLERTKTTPEARARLREALPNANITPGVDN